MIMLKTALIAIGGVAVLGTPAFLRAPNERALVLALPGAAAGEAARAGLSGGGLLVSMSADGRAAVFDVASGEPFRPHGSVIVLRSPDAEGCAKDAN